MSSCIQTRRTACERCGRIWEHGPYVFICSACHKALVERKKKEEKEMVHKGDKVKKNRKYYVPEKDKEKIFVVASEPWDVCGTAVVQLEGVRGSYAADGLEKVEE